MTANRAGRQSPPDARHGRRLSDQYWLLIGAVIFFLEIVVAVVVLQAVL